ncbi:MAG: hypothetical protein AAF366_05045 [Pseudomonadota bacterium]
MSRVLLLLVLPLAACNAANPAYEARVMALADANEEVSPGLASCLLSIGRPDVALDPAAEMSPQEIEQLILCTAERAAE